jgi:hypothetical protein
MLLALSSGRNHSNFDTSNPFATWARGIKLGRKSVDTIMTGHMAIL